MAEDVPPDSNAVSIFALREVQRLRDAPPDIDMCLWRLTPQAILRDLYRPAIKFDLNPLDLERHEFCFDGGASAIKDTKGTLYTNYRVPIEALLQTSRQMRAEYQALKQTMALPWADAPRFGKRYLPASMASLL